MIAISKPRGLLSTVLISFFLTSFAGFLWIGRGRAAVFALTVMTLLLAAAFFLGGFAAFSVETSLTGIGGSTLGPLIDMVAVGLVHVAVVLPFRYQSRPVKWYSNGHSVACLTLALPVLLVFVVRTFVFQLYSTPSGSMVPALVEGDYLFASKYAYGYSRYSAPFAMLPVSGRILFVEPERGDVVIFKLPADPGIDYVKRVVGLPGDRIQLVDGVLHINGKPVGLERKIGRYDNRATGVSAELQRETLPNGVSYRLLNLVDGSPGDNTREFLVPEGHYFMLGDNRDNSTDSRFNVGFVPAENLVGRAEAIYWNAEGREYSERALLRPAHASPDPRSPSNN